MTGDVEEAGKITGDGGQVAGVVWAGESGWLAYRG